MSHGAIPQAGPGRWRALPAVIIGLALASLLCSCGSTVAKPANTLPWPEKNAPDELHGLADDLLAFQAAIGHLPDDLVQLDHSGLALNGPYAKIGYAYHPLGIGILPDGWRIMAADDRVREANQVWCVLRPAVKVSGSAALRVALVPMAALREVAAAASGGK